jgi:hypothetical protein
MHGEGLFVVMRRRFFSSYLSNNGSVVEFAIALRYGISHQLRMRLGQR